MELPISVRDERPDDTAAVRNVHIQAFGPDHGPVVADLVDDGLRALAADEDGLSLVAEEEDGQVVGQVMFTRALLDAPRRLLPVRVLSPLGVLPERQRKGIGAALVAAGLKILDERGAPLVFLEGDPGYYPRLGFRPGGDRGFRKPSLRIPDAAFQVVELAAYEPWMTGTLVYPDVFWRHDCVGLREPEAQA